KTCEYLRRTRPLAVEVAAVAHGLRARAEAAIRTLADAWLEQEKYRNSKATHASRECLQARFGFQFGSLGFPAALVGSPAFGTQHSAGHRSGRATKSNL